MGCFLNVMSYFLNNLIFNTSGLKIASLGPSFRRSLAPCLEIIWHYYFDVILMPGRHINDIIKKAEKYPMEIRNVMSHIWVGSFEFVTKRDGMDGCLEIPYQCGVICEWPLFVFSIGNSGRTFISDQCYTGC